MSIKMGFIVSLDVKSLVTECFSSVGLTLSPLPAASRATTDVKEVCYTCVLEFVCNSTSTAIDSYRSCPGFNETEVACMQPQTWCICNDTFLAFSSYSNVSFLSQNMNITTRERFVTRPYQLSLQSTLGSERRHFFFLKGGRE